MGIFLCTREDVKTAMDSSTTARDNERVDRAIESASRSVEGWLRRKFRPVLATRYFDWPDRGRSFPWRVWLEEDELISATAVVAGGVTVSSADYFLEPVNSGPPYNRLEIDLSSASWFSSGPTYQRNIAITGLFGHSNDEEVVGTLAAPLGADATATAAINWSTSRIGVGEVLRIDNERIITTEHTMVDSTQDLGAALLASNADVSVYVTDGTAFAAGQVLLVNSERLLIVDIAGNVLTVKRAWDGSVLAAHASTGVSIYTYTGFETDRAQLGTTLAAHLTGAVIYRHVVPALVRELTIAEAVNSYQQGLGGYGRTTGSEDNLQDAVGGGLKSIRFQTRDRYGRMRMGAV